MVKRALRVAKRRLGLPTELAEHTQHSALSTQHIVEPRFRLPSVVLATIGVLAVLMLAYLGYRLLPVLLLIFVSMLFATAIEPLVNWLRRGPFNRSAGILTVYTSLFLLVGLIGYVTVPVIIAQVGELSTALPDTIEEVKQNVDRMPNEFLRQQAATFVGAAQSIIDRFNHPRPEENVATITQTALGLAEAFFSVITFFVVAYFGVHIIGRTTALRTGSPSARSSSARSYPGCRRNEPTGCAACGTT